MIDTRDEHIDTVAALKGVEDAVPGLASLLAKLTNEVKIEYSKQLAKFDEAIVTADRWTDAVTTHTKIIVDFLERIARDYPYLKYSDELALCLRHDSMRMLDGIVPNAFLPIYENQSNPFRAPVGKAIIA